MTTDPTYLFAVPPIEPEVDPVQAVFDYWTTTMRSKSVVRCVLTDKRRKIIAKALKDYDVATCLAAIDGCALSDFHMGQNSRNRKYDSLELIFRDADRIERFASDAINAIAPTGDFDTPTNIEVDW